ncbi:type II secretion system F family protein [Chitinimonas sp. BJYL2]|uniref:type II secretion system F family protein n=1 Tax=Chitinimonas sp. BJYL2 TaxID=2976696 RepID=UPI0022B4C5F9|nr:type II secretion system F family protein [Chitinimonas sp. BJYL2]
MARFRIKALANTGEVARHEVEAATEDEARHVIVAAGGRVLTLDAVGSGMPTGFRASPFNLTVFNQQLHSLLEAGQPIVDTIEILGRNDRAGRHQSVYASLLTSLQQGKQLSEAMANLPSVFPPLYVAMVRASETTGTVRAAIRRFMHYQKQIDEIRGKLISAAIYPAILIGVGFLVVAFLMLYVVPRFSAVFDDVSARNNQVAGLVQLWGTFVREHGVFAWSTFFLIVAGIVTLLVHPVPRAWVSRRLLNMPWVGERLWILQLARLYRTLSMLLKSGVSVLSAMRMTEASLSPAMRGDLQAAAIQVSQGMPLSMVFPEHRLSTEVAQRLLLAGESSGNLDDMMERIADFYDQEVATWIDVAGRLIEPVLMVVIGLIIGGIVMMLYTPIFDLANAI